MRTEVAANRRPRSMSAPSLYLRLDVHKDSVTVAVFGAGERE
jgi:hypothetical protein